MENPSPVRPCVRTSEAFQTDSTCAPGMLGPIVEELEDTVPTGIDENVSDESRDVQRRKMGRPPSSSEIQEHNRLHMPYRSWCPVCVSAKAPDLPHFRRGAAEEDSAQRDEVSLDYCFMKDVVGGPTATVLAGRDRKSGLYIGHAVPFKGTSTEWIADQIERDLRKMGY